LREKVTTCLFVHPLKFSDVTLQARVTAALALPPSPIPRTAVIITTIHGPTEASTAFLERFPLVDLVIVGDRKTPHDQWRRVRNAFYLDPETQIARFGALATLLPWNSYVRKNLGYLWAFSSGYDAIVDTDDDTVPNDRWLEPLRSDIRLPQERVSGPAYPNMYKLFTDRHIWPRGFPLQLISASELPRLHPLDPATPATAADCHDLLAAADRLKLAAADRLKLAADDRLKLAAADRLKLAAADRLGLSAGLSAADRLGLSAAVGLPSAARHDVAGDAKTAASGGVVDGMDGPAGGVVVVQALVDGDPDVDAIFRLTQDAASSDAKSIQSFRFDSKRETLCVLDKGVRCAFNSQNTYWLDRSAFLQMYLPATATFRVCDILRSYVAQDALWRHGQRLAFYRATTRQERNPHNLLHDLESEFHLYTKLDSVLSIVAATSAKGIAATYETLAATGIVTAAETAIAKAWLHAARAALQSRPPTS
jgi:hypothetical protein